MKISTSTDFTKLPRVASLAKGGDAGPEPFDSVVLAHDERHLRRRVLTLRGGEKVLVDFLEPVHLEDGDRLLLEDGRAVGIVAADEDLLEVRARDPRHLAELAWHIGNRHLAAGIEADRILILRDHVIEAMLEGLGAQVAEVNAPFQPARGAYSGQSHGHAHHGHEHHGHHDHGHDHGHEHGERDRFGRLPGDPHYGHNHG
jgi:urease accessory protein